MEGFSYIKMDDDGELWDSVDHAHGMDNFQSIQLQLNDRADNINVDSGETIILDAVHYAAAPCSVKIRRPVPRTEAISTELRGDTYTAEDAIEQIGLGCFQWKVLFFACMFSATDALEMMLLAVLAPEVRCYWRLQDWQVASISTIVFVGMLVGSNVWGFFSDRYGRRPTLIIAACWIGYYGILTSQSPNYTWIVLLRGLVGFGFGGAVQHFTIMSEYLPSKYRAKLLTINGVVWSLGSAFEILMAYLIIPRAGWRMLVFISALPMVFSIFSALALPESLRYLLAAGQNEKAAHIVKLMAASNGKQPPTGQLTASAEEPRGQFKDLLVPGLRRTTLVLWLLWFSVACIYYGIILSQSEILERGGMCAGKHERQNEGCYCQPLQASSYVSMIASTFGEFAAIPFNLMTIDSLGRKWTLGLNFLGGGLFCFLAQICSSHTIILTVTLFGVRSFICGVFRMIYIYTSEVLPTTVRSIGLGTCSSMARVGAILTPFVAQVLMAYSAHLSLSFYATLCIASSVAVFFLPIETKGRALQQSLSTMVA